MSYSAAFLTTLEISLKKEGKWSNHPSDRGGKTMYGCTEAICKKYGYDVTTLTLQQAQEIYFKEFWKPLRLDEIYPISQRIAEEVFDTGINCGPGTAAKWLQTWLNKFNRGGKDYPDMNVDGGIGPLTLNALAAFLNLRGRDGETVLFRALNSVQCVHYGNMADNDVRQEDFMFGWVLHRVQ